MLDRVRRTWCWHHRSRCGGYQQRRRSRSKIVSRGRMLHADIYVGGREIAVGRRCQWQLLNGQSVSAIASGVAAKRCRWFWRAVLPRHRKCFDKSCQRLFVALSRHLKYAGYLPARYFGNGAFVWPATHNTSKFRGLFAEVVTPLWLICSKGMFICGRFHGKHLLYCWLRT